ncbi:translation initiation factor IF-2 subunit alpha [Candidatus Bathyarchaeota archaeon]|nr:translation initiation factor IF-2 subunit alpha [Candidatus Bathyarchaeota archaeon]
MSLGLPDWPEVGYIVIATVLKVESYGAYVRLDEYSGKEGLLHISEISSRWVRNIRNHVRRNQKVVLQVMRTDKKKGQVDLSLRRVSRDDRRKKLEDWKKARKAETLLTGAASQLGVELMDLYESDGIKLVERYETLYGGLEVVSKNGLEALAEVGITGKTADILNTIAKDKIIISQVTIQGLIKMTSLGNNGVEEIKMSFIDAGGVAEEHGATIKITTKGAPKYRIDLMADDYKTAEFAMDKTVTSMEEVWDKLDGTFSYERQ